MHHLIDPVTGQKLPGFGTPRLLSEGGGKAYAVEAGDRGPIWYLFVPGEYVSPTDEYRNVRVAEFFDFEVEIEATLTGEGSEEYDAPNWDDTFWVEAQTANEAEELAYKKVAEFVGHNMPEAEGFEITRYRTRKVY